MIQTEVLTKEFIDLYGKPEMKPRIFLHQGELTLSENIPIITEAMYFHVRLILVHTLPSGKQKRIQFHLHQ